MNQDELLKCVTEEKVAIEGLVADLRNQIADLIQRTTNLQRRLNSEPEEKARSLCKLIEEQTHSTSAEISRRNTAADHKGIKGEAWARFMLGMN